ncbi:MAG TPA: phospholipase D-like domain-containing protein, partial [Gemmatimonadales bacterium]
MTARPGTAEQSVACAINRAAAGRPVPGNKVDLLIDGPDTYAAMLELIADAARWIHFENYIIRSDAVGRRFADALIERARAGIRVRVLYDAIGSLYTSRALWRDLRRAGVEVRGFHPIRPLNLVTNFSRNHRKLVVADGARSVIGGLCIGCEWTGEGHR